MMDEVVVSGVESCRRKAAKNAYLNISKRNSSQLKKVTLLMRKRHVNKKLTAEELQFLADNSKLVDQYNLRQEKRKVYLSRHIETEDHPELLREKCIQLAQAIHDAEFLVVYTGAGISTAASIPDYRGPNGIWTRLQKGEDIGSHDLTEAEPTFTHMALTALQRCGKLHHIVSQNCDGLHLRSGLPKTSLSEVHGNMYIEVCRKCVPAREYVRTFDVTERTSTYKHCTGRRCYRCGEPLVDSIVHFGERGKLRWPLNWQGACQAANGSDTILCLGSSLKVLKKYSWLWQMDRPSRRRPRLYIVNLQWTPKDKEATLKINGKCDEVMQLVMTHIGVEVPAYNRAEDPIFQMATPLHPDELHTTTRPCLVPPPPSFSLVSSPASPECACGKRAAEEAETVDYVKSSRDASRACSQGSGEACLCSRLHCNQCDECECVGASNKSSYDSSSSCEDLQRDSNSGCGDIERESNSCCVGINIDKNNLDICGYDENSSLELDVSNYANSISSHQSHRVEFPCDTSLDNAVLCSKRDSLCSSDSQLKQSMALNASHCPASMCKESKPTSDFVRGYALKLDSSSVPLRGCLTVEDSRSITDRNTSRHPASHQDNQHINVEEKPKLNSHINSYTNGQTISIEEKLVKTEMKNIPDSKNTKQSVSDKPKLFTDAEKKVLESNAAILNALILKAGPVERTRHCNCSLVMHKLQRYNSCHLLLSCQTCGRYMRFFPQGSCVQSGGPSSCTVPDLFCSCIEQGLVRWQILHSHEPFNTVDESKTQIKTELETDSKVKIENVPEKVLVDEKVRNGFCSSTFTLKNECVQKSDISSPHFLARNERIVKIDDNDENSIRSSSKQTVKEFHEKKNACLYGGLGDQNNLTGHFFNASKFSYGPSEEIKLPFLSAVREKFSGTGLCIRSAAFDALEDSSHDEDDDASEEDVIDGSHLLGVAIDSHKVDQVYSSEVDDSEDEVSLNDNEQKSKCFKTENVDVQQRCVERTFESRICANTSSSRIVKQVSIERDADALKQCPDGANIMVSYLCKRPSNAGETAVVSKNLRVEDIMEFTSGDSLDGICENNHDDELSDCSNEPFNDESPTDVRWSPLTRTSGSRMPLPRRSRETSGVQTCKHRAVNNTSNLKISWHLTEKQQSKNDELSTSDEVVSHQNTRNDGCNLVSTVRNGLVKQSHSLLEAEMKEMKDIWVNSFCGPRKDLQSELLSESQNYCFDESPRLGKIENEFETVNLADIEDDKEDNVKKLWFWGFEDNIIENTSNDTSLVNLVNDEQDSICEKTPKSACSFTTGGSNEGPSSSPPRRMTRSRTKSISRVGQTKEDSDVEGDDTEDEEMECCFCEGEFSANLCARSRENVSNRLPPDEATMRARAVIARRRNVSYKRFDPIFSVKIKKLTVDSGKRKLKRGTVNLSGPRFRRTSAKENESKSRTLMSNTTSGVNIGDIDRNAGDSDAKSDDVPKLVKKVVPGWYGKGYRKLVRKKVPKSYPLK